MSKTGLSVWRRGELLLFSVVLALAAFVSVGSSASKPVEAATCWDRGCNQLWPQNYDCSNSQYVASWDTFTNDSDMNGVYPYTQDNELLQYVELRISNHCAAGWGRAYVYGALAGCTSNCYWTGISFEGLSCCASGPNINYLFAGYTNYWRDNVSGSTNWSWMLGGGPNSAQNWVRNCEYNDYNECTGWH